MCDKLEFECNAHYTAAHKNPNIQPSAEYKLPILSLHRLFTIIKHKKIQYWFIVVVKSRITATSDMSLGVATWAIKPGQRPPYHNYYKMMSDKIRGLEIFCKFLAFQKVCILCVYHQFSKFDAIQTEIGRHLQNIDFLLFAKSSIFWAYTFNIY
jgi:hypothetical protein